MSASVDHPPAPDAVPASAGAAVLTATDAPTHARGEQPPGPAPAARALQQELDVLRTRLEEAEDMLRAIRAGEVDALVIQSPAGPRTYTLVTADEAYRRLIEQIPEAALTLGLDGVVLYSNGRLPELLSVSRDDIPGRTLSDFCVPEDRPRLLELLERGRNEGVSGEVRLRGRPGSPGIPFQVSLNPLESGDFRGICAVAVDLREQRRREQAAIEERLTRAILEFAGTAIVVCDGSGRILRVNRMASDLFGAALSGSFADLFGGDAAFEALTAAAEADERRELECGRAGGGRAWLLAGARRIGELAAPENPRWVITLSDITDRKQIESERARLLEAEREARSLAEAANQAKTQFLAVMSHELRTPLSAVIGYADLLEQGVAGVANPMQLQYVDRIKASAWHLLGLIEGILTFSRVEAGKESTRIEETDLATVGREAAELVATLAAAKQLELRVLLSDGLPAAFTDSAKLRQILVNLLANAVKFTDTGNVELKLEQSGAYATFDVRDTGRGIEPEDLGRIFEPFVQADQSPTRRNGGTGLGLTIARRFADMIGADIAVDSRPGEGSTFTLRVPLGV